MKTSQFDYPLPEGLIAQIPAEKRDHSLLMVLNPKSGTVDHRKFRDIIDYLRPGDLLILNDTKVIPARLIGRKAGGIARIEILLVNRVPSTVDRYECLVKPGKRLKVGSRVVFGRGELIGTVLEKKENGEQILEFQSDGKFEEVIQRIGKVPLPPYIKNAKSTKRYQTVYAEREGASAAPTAGLHFTKGLLNRIESKGIKIKTITLHTGIATFRPVYVEDIKEHKMHQESYSISNETIKALDQAKRVIAVGTTTVRALESYAKTKKREGATDLFIYPGFKFRIVDALITNFHFPRSSLLILVSAFAGREFILGAYKKAIQKKYRFFSFGDAMFINPR